MLTIAALILATSQTPPAAKPINPLAPVIWIDPRGDILVDSQEVTPKFDAGVEKVKTPYGMGYDFNGAKSGIRLPDQGTFKITGDLSISAWLFVRNFAPNGEQSEVLFRGDDRNGLDPYGIMVTHDGSVKFYIYNEKNQEAEAKTALPLNQWAHVLGTLNAATGEISIYLDGNKMTTVSTKIRPFSELEQKSAPGVGIGNVQSDKSPSNQPLNGILADVRLYARLTTPAETGFRYVSAPTGASPQ